ncbi:hypothetical protein BCY91_09455 [Pelobium manganitolerans]|uniref:Uncharacterized protein n=1 Tax=Pelobium manganitolerans TaxID=1842495 RepID=A0A419S3A6_9SPHI|nr:hypothetical protein BCY91_09455 [Pelobium manganitolerans]
MNRTLFRTLILLIFLIRFGTHVQEAFPATYNSPDTLNAKTAKSYHQKAYGLRLTDPQLSLSFARRAESIALKIGDSNELAEAYRISGIAFTYLNERDSAINKYLKSLSLFQKNEDELGEARVSNNIANIWVDIDYEKSLVYFKRVLKIALKRNVKDLTAGAYLNIGNAYYQNKQYKISLDNYEKSRKIFTVTKNTIGLTQSLQNIGLIYYRTGNLELAENYLLLAKARAQEYSLNNTIAMLNLTLSSIYMAKNNFPAASNCITEGLAFANLIGDEHRKKQFIYSLYELEKKQNNFKEALGYLKEVYIYDSLNYRRNLASNIGLVQQTFKQQQTQKENELTIQSQRNAKKLSLAIGIVAVLSFFVIFLLIKSNRRSKESNQQLQELNDEIITQKNKVDRINHQLEELIAERTKDLIIKNQKLSEYSSHLSHQIRGPVATLKGLMMLVEENMVQSNEIAPQIKKCVDDIDTKIMDINDALNDPTKKGLS